MKFLASGLCLLALGAISLAREGGEAEAPEALIDAVKSAAPNELPLRVHRLMHAGPEALAATRRARDEAVKPETRKALARAVLWQLAKKMEPVLLAGFATQLTFDGQYLELNDEGPEALESLLGLVEDVASAPELRLAACRALADVAAARFTAPSAPPAGDGKGQAAPLEKEAFRQRLRALHEDVLLPPVLQEQGGILLAILGDTHALDAEIDKLERTAMSDDPFESTASHVQLANLNYRIRKYDKAVRSYDKILAFYERLLEIQKQNSAPERVKAQVARELSLHYYNAACSNALHKDIEKCKALIRKAVKLDPVHYVNMVKDGDLKNLQRDPSFESFRAELGKLFEKEEL